MTAARATRAELKDLLERSKGTAAPAPPREAPVQNIKTDEEIMMLMEDENDDAQADGAPGSAPETCSEILASQRQCKNKAKADGKCHLHHG
jgi:poly-beta-hydroxyalkanoate depolymerase